MADPAALIDRQKALANYLVSGWPSLKIPSLVPVSAAAIVGNATQENSCRSVTTGSALDHGSNGLFQWRLGRLTEMQGWCTTNFGTWQAIEPQAAFFCFECMRDYPALWVDLVAGKQSLATLTLNITDQYERPSDAGRVPDIRIGYATTFFNAWGGLPPIPAPIPKPIPAPVPTPLPPTPTPITPTGVTTLNPLIEQIIEVFAAALVKALVAQFSVELSGLSLSTSTTSTNPGISAPASTPALDLGSLANVLVPILTSSLGATLPGMIASELSKIIPVPKA